MLPMLNMPPDMYMHVWHAAGRAVMAAPWGSGPAPGRPAAASRGFTIIKTYSTPFGPPTSRFWAQGRPAGFFFSTAAGPLAYKLAESQ